MNDSEFIEGELREWGGKVRREMMLSIDRLDAIRSGALKRSVNVVVQANNLQFVFAHYGRFVDMGGGRGVPVGKRGTNAFDRSRSGNGRLKKYKRVAKKFYSKTTYGMLGQLHNQLLAGYADKVIDAVKNDMQR